MPGAPDFALYGAPKVDCHCHVLDPHGFPYAGDVSYRPAGQETGSADYLAQVLDVYGVQHSLLVGPNSGYGTDNRCMLAAIAGGAGRFKGIAVVPHDASVGYLQELQAQGVVGISFNYSLHGLAKFALHGDGHQVASIHAALPSISDKAASMNSVRSASSESARAASRD